MLEEFVTPLDPTYRVCLATSLIRQMGRDVQQGRVDPNAMAFTILRANLTLNASEGFLLTINHLFQDEIAECANS